MDTNLINRNNGERSWFHNLYENLNAKNAAKTRAQSSAKIAKYAELLCAACGAPHTKEYVVNQLRGVCADCHCDDWVDIKQAEQEKTGNIFECFGCDQTYARKDLTKGMKCECGSTRFASIDLLEQVSANTVEYLQSRGLNVEDVSHQRGKIFATISGKYSDGNIWRTAIVASGHFTKNDVILFAIDENGGAATVATFQDDPLIKMAKNTQCESYWETETDNHIQTKTKAAAHLIDCRGRELVIGSQIEWRTPKGPMRGEIIKAYKNGIIQVGMTYDEYGPAKAGTFGTTVELDQDSINDLQVESF